MTAKTTGRASTRDVYTLQGTHAVFTDQPVWHVAKSSSDSQVKAMTSLFSGRERN